MDPTATAIVGRRLVLVIEVHRLHWPVAQDPGGIGPHPHIDAAHRDVSADPSRADETLTCIDLGPTPARPHHDLSVAGQDPSRRDLDRGLREDDEVE